MHALRFANIGHTLAFVIILVVAIGLRLLYLNQPMRHDEALTFLDYASTPLSNITTAYEQPNNHILHTILVHFAYQLLGNEPWVLRLPALVAGILIVPFTYVVTHNFYNRQTALMAAGLVAVSLPLVEYATNARGYTIITLIFLLLLDVARRLVHHNHMSLWLAYTVLAVLGFYTIPAMLFPMGVVALWLLVSGWRSFAGDDRAHFRQAFVRWHIFAAIITLVLYMPVIFNAGIGAVIGNQAVTSLTLTEFVGSLPLILIDLVTFPLRGYPLIIAIILIVCALFGLAVHKDMATERLPVLLVALLWIVPVILLLRLSPADRTWVFLAPLVSMTAAAGLTRFMTETPRLVSMIVPLLTIGIGWHLVVSDAVLNSEQTGNVPDAERMALALAQIRQPGDVVFLDIPYDAPVRYYLNYHGHESDFVRNPFDIPPNSRLVETDGRLYVWGVGAGDVTRFIEGFNLNLPPFALRLRPLQYDIQPPLQQISLIAPPDGLLFRDTFDDFISNAWVFNEIEYQLVQDGGDQVIELRTRDDWGEMLLLGGEDWNNYALDIRVKIAQRSNLEVDDLYTNIRYQPNIGTYLGTINTINNQANIGFEVNGERIDFERERFALTEAAWYRLTLRGRGDQIELYINNERISMVEENSLLNGTIRIVIPPNARILIDEVRVAGL